MISEDINHKEAYSESNDKLFIINYLSESNDILLMVLVASWLPYHTAISIMCMDSWVQQQ